MKRDKKKTPAAAGLPGSITIYMMLSLVIVLVLICTLVESGRVSALSYRLRSVTYTGLDSVFSEYAEPVFEDYGIMVLWLDSDEIISEFTEFTGYNLDDSDLSYSADAHLYSARLAGCSLSSISYITDDSGLIFAEQVYEYMDYYLAESAAQELLESLDIFSGSEAVSAFVEKLESVSEVFIKVESSVSAIKELTEDIQDMTEDPAGLLESLYDIASSFSETDVVSAEFSQTLTELKNAKSALTYALEEVLEKTQEYYECVQDAQGAADELEEILLSGSDGLDEEIYESLKEQVDELKSTGTDTEEDYYSVGANSELTEEYLASLESLEELFEQLDDALNSENAQEYARAIAQFQELFSDFDLGNLGVELDIETVSGEDSSVLSTVADLIDGGVLAYVMDDISEKTIETEDLPSESEDTSGSETEESLTDATLNKVIFGQYVLDHFGNAVETKDDTALDYEVEYIIAGKDSDVANMKVIAAEITALRSTLNFISILKDTQKKAEAETLAAAMVGFTGMPLLIKAFQMLILSAWSAAEAVTDVKSLLEGEKVATIKASDEWNLSIDAFKNFTGSGLEAFSCERGLEYEDYLRVLLAMQNRQKQYFRTMDMIQADMCLNENEDFRMAECAVSAELTASYSARQIFTDISWVKSALSSSGGNYAFSISESYEY